MRIVIVYQYCHAGGEIGIARVVRPLKLKSVEEAEAQQSQERRKCSDRSNYENIRCNIWKIIISHAVCLTWKSVYLSRNILDQRKTDENNQNGIKLNQWNIQKGNLVPCLTKHNYWLDGFIRMIQMVMMYGNTWSGDSTCEVFTNTWFKKSYLQLVRFCLGKWSLLIKFILTGKTPARKCFYSTSILFHIIGYNILQFNLDSFWVRSDYIWTYVRILFGLCCLRVK